MEKAIASYRPKVVKLLTVAWHRLKGDFAATNGLLSRNPEYYNALTAPVRNMLQTGALPHRL